MYATPEDYKKYGDGLIPDEQLEKALSRASDQIDSLTYNRIVAKGFDHLTPFQQTNIKKSVCRQADFFFQYGGFLNMPLSGYSAGSVSLSFNAVEGGGGIQTSEGVMNLLSATGLTSRRL
ncbi:hypothetical protein [Sporosarcina sp. USHLN248]|uniref:hypothetical protein n=1 Tax=Sporosarcina sp. USHLN248 TaxID=3081300 RepID=UPI00301A7D54